MFITVRLRVQVRCLKYLIYYTQVTKKACKILCEYACLLICSRAACTLKLTNNTIQVKRLQLCFPLILSNEHNDSFSSFTHQRTLILFASRKFRVVGVLFLLLGIFYWNHKFRVSILIDLHCVIKISNDWIRVL